MSANWFIALPVAAGSWFDALSAPAGTRLFAARDLHLTVAFLGGATPERAHHAFSGAAQFPLPALEIGLASVVALGSPRRPSAFSSLLSLGREQVEAAIASTRDAFCDAAGARRDARPPLAHVTLARPLRSATPAQVRAARTWAAGLDLHHVRAHITEVALFTWSSDRARSLFQVEASQTLAR
jgi:2'-5' RNA ligase